MIDGTDMVARARALVGTRFRAHGRAPASGLDCVGLVAHAAGVAGPRGYRTRGGTAEDHAALLRTYGLAPAEALRPGDILLCRSAPGTFHLAIDTGAAVVHADGVAGRVVERPGPAPWPVLSRWRVPVGARLRAGGGDD